MNKKQKLLDEARQRFRFCEDCRFYKPHKIKASYFGGTDECIHPGNWHIIYTYKKPIARRESPRSANSRNNCKYWHVR